MTWPSWYDGAADLGPIANRYHVRTYPSIFVIDAKGIIRARQHFSVDQDVDKLLEQMKRPESSSRCVAPRVPRKTKSVANNTVWDRAKK